VPELHGGAEGQSGEREEDDAQKELDHEVVQTAARNCSHGCGRMAGQNGADSTRAWDAAHRFAAEESGEEITALVRPAWA
jgi:hypothetical protein